MTFLKLYTIHSSFSQLFFTLSKRVPVSTVSNSRRQNKKTKKNNICIHVYKSNDTKNYTDQ